MGHRNGLASLSFDIAHQVTQRKTGSSFAVGFDGGGYLRGANPNRLSCITCTMTHPCGTMLEKVSGPGGPAVGTKGAFLLCVVPACLPVCQPLCLVLLSKCIYAVLNTELQTTVSTDKRTGIISKEFQ